MRALYPPIEPFKTDTLSVSALHTLYIEQCGNPDGLAVVFLHGGPGYGCTPAHRQFFNPDKWRIILFDQRGCGRSTPHAELRENTTAHLIADLEAIRNFLALERWTIFGGSWGSTLALAYTQAFPERVSALILRGIFLMRRQEIDWFYREGTSRLFPDRWQAYQDLVKDFPPSRYVEAYYNMMTGSDKALRAKATMAWTKWESNTAFLREQGEDDIDEKSADAVGRIECHYMMNGGWFSPDDQLLNDAAKLRGIPGVIVHGRYDVICPFENAWQLHKAWPESILEVVDDAGHSAFEDGIRTKLLEYTDFYADILQPSK